MSHRTHCPTPYGYNGPPYEVHVTLCYAIYATKPGSGMTIIQVKYKMITPILIVLCGK